MTAVPEKPAPRVSPDVLKAVIAAYYPDAIAGANQARTRAAAAQSISTLLVGTIVGLLSVSGFGEWDGITKAIALLSAIAWAVVSILFLRAVAAPVKMPNPHPPIDSDDEVVRVILQRAKSARDEVDRRQALAGKALYVALSITLVTGLLASVRAPSEDWSGAVLTVSPEQVSALSLKCPSVTSRIIGEVNTSTLKRPTFEFAFECGDGSVQRIELEASSLTRLVIIDE